MRNFRYVLSAKGAASFLDWGNAPGFASIIHKNLFPGALSQAGNESRLRRRTMTLNTNHFRDCGKRIPLKISDFL